MTEPRAQRLKRLRMRSWRRGTKEMDMILGAFADAHLERLEPEVLELYDRLLEENDQDLYRWVAAGDAPPAWAGALVEQLRAFTAAAGVAGRAGSVST